MMKRYDPMLYAFLAFIFMLSCVNVFSSSRGDEDLTLEVTLDGAEIMRSPLRRFSGRKEIEFRRGDGFNIISAGEDGVRMVSADCPGGDCLRTRAINSAGGIIVCIPHRLTVKLTSRQDSVLDAVSY
ncbi:MAG: NusG domain II-containing protein [Synergistaceae bacterium]|jgi:hypothetical protein|nr:NusG domain II-containing protein [Synergistaceae bacterium]